MANMSEEWREDIVEAAKDQSDKQIEKGVKTKADMMYEKYREQSSGITPKEINSYAIEVMKELGIDISKHSTKNFFKNQIAFWV